MGVVKAIFGGTFDPVHFGHIKVAERAKSELDLDEVIFMPAGDPWMKKGFYVSPASDRLEMVELAISDYEGFSVSTLEIDREGASYTVDTIREIASTMNEDDQLYFLMGWDTLLKFGFWKEPEEILKLCKLIAFPRLGCEVPTKEVLDKILPDLYEKTIMLDEQFIDISATAIRDSIKNGDSIREFVPDKVAEYIEMRGLYNF
jgi:nicotinate-nucleotide adenylyltransferase